VFGKVRVMKTVSGVLLALPTFFFLMSFVYNPFQEWWVTSLFSMLSVLSAAACLVWAWIIRRRSRPLAWACVTVGVVYFVLLVVVPLVAPVPKTRRAGAESIGACNGASGLQCDIRGSRCAVANLPRSGKRHAL
jgi:hypothetical protein